VPHICMPCAAVHGRHWLLVHTSVAWHALLQGVEQVPDWKLQFWPFAQGPPQPLPQLFSVTTTHLSALGQRFWPLAHALAVPSFLVVPVDAPGALSELVPELLLDVDVGDACAVSAEMASWLAAAALAAAALTAFALPLTMPPVTPLPPDVVPGRAPTVAALAEPAVSTCDAGACVAAAVSVPIVAAPEACAPMDCMPVAAASCVADAGLAHEPSVPVDVGAAVAVSSTPAPLGRAAPCATAAVDVVAAMPPPHVTPLLPSVLPSELSAAAPFTPAALETPAFVCPAMGCASCSSWRMVASLEFSCAPSLASAPGAAVLTRKRILRCCRVQGSSSGPGAPVRSCPTRAPPALYPLAGRLGC